MNARQHLRCHLHLRRLEQRIQDEANYPHNVHAAIVPESDKLDEWSFESWRMTIRGGVFCRFLRSSVCRSVIGLGDEFTTCRIFRWAACFYQNRPNESWSIGRNAGNQASQEGFCLTNTKPTSFCRNRGVD